MQYYATIMVLKFNFIVPNPLGGGGGGRRGRAINSNGIFCAVNFEQSIYSS